MKKLNILFWIFTALFAAAMLFSSVPDVIQDEQTVKYMASIGYPPYFTPFIGVAKILGVIAILVPGNFPRIKEWAYAGLFFDLIGATYSNICSFGVNGQLVGFMTAYFALGIASYVFYHKRRQALGQAGV